MTRLLALVAAIAACLVIPAAALAAAPEESRSAFYRLNDPIGPGAADSAANLVTNPSFEADTSGWAATGAFFMATSTLTRFSDAGAPEGGYVGKVVTPASWQAGAGTNVPLKAGRRYRVRVLVKRDTGGSSLRIALGEIASPNEELVVAAAATPSSTGYTEYTQVVSAARDGSYRLYVRTTANTATTFYVDAASVREEPEQVGNPSFETNTSGWITSGGFLAGTSTLTRVADTGAAGSYVGKVVTPATWGAGTATDVNVRAGQKYKVRVLVKRQAGGANLRIAMGEVASPNEELVVAANVSPSASSYNEYTATVTPARSGTYRLYVRTEGSSTATTFYVDGASVRPETPEYVGNTSFETNTTGWAASGAFFMATSTLTRVSDSGAPDGGYVGKVVTPASWQAGAATDVSVVGGRKYKVRVLVKRETGGSNLRIALGEIASPNEELVVVASATPSSTGYTEYTGTVTPTRSGTYRFYVRTTNNTATTFYLDDVSVREGNAGIYKGGVTLNQPGATPDGDTAADFNGTSGYVDLPSILNPGTTGFSIEAWVKLDSAALGADRTVVSQRDGTGTGRTLLYYRGSTGTFSTFLGGTSIDSDVVAEANRWYHLVLTYEGGADGTVKIYVDGVDSLSAVTTAESANGGWLIGVAKTRTVSFWDGVIDDVAIYPRELSATEVQGIAPPDTTITSGPSGDTATTSPQFGYSSNESTAGFECKLTPVESNWTACNTSPKSYSSLAEGDYTFNVRAKDDDGIVDPAPATRSFTVVVCDEVAQPSGPITTLGGLDDALTDNETGCFHAGTYTQTSRNLTTPGATFRPYPGESATLRGRIVTTGADITIRGLILDGSYGTLCVNDSNCNNSNNCFDENKCTLPSPTIGGLRTRLIGNDISNRRVDDSEAAGICVNESNSSSNDPTGYLIESNRIHRCGQIDSSDGVTVTNHDHGIYMGGGEASSGTINNNVVYDNADRGIQLYPAAVDVTITHNTIDDNGAGLHFGGLYYDDFGNPGGPFSDNNTATDNVISRSRISGRENLEWFNLPSPTDAGQTPSTDNLVDGVCLWDPEGGGGNIDSQFTQRVELTGDTTVTDSPYANSAEGNYTIIDTSDCAGMGATGAVTQPYE